MSRSVKRGDQKMQKKLIKLVEMKWPTSRGDQNVLRKFGDLLFIYLVTICYRRPSEFGLVEFPRDAERGRLWRLCWRVASAPACFAHCSHFNPSPHHLSPAPSRPDSTDAQEPDTRTESFSPSCPASIRRPTIRYTPFLAGTFSKNRDMVCVLYLFYCGIPESMYTSSDGPQTESVTVCPAGPAVLRGAWCAC